MSVAAAVLAGIWFLVAFALRIAVQVRRHHDTGVRLDAGPPLSVSWWARWLFTASVVGVAVTPVLVAADALDPLERLDHDAVAWAGVILAVLGIGLTFWAQLAMGASWRIGVDPSEQTVLVTAGPFAVVRNPIFSTMALTALGLTLMAPTGIGLAALALLVTALELQVRGVEEPHLVALHGPAFEAYAARTGRFVPRLTRLSRARSVRPGSPPPAAAAPAGRSVHR
ncbi:MAG TPA: isoprenylcysteine carboxylmethyltransferase family protein [Acidimicrobiales bacterium]|nr:isoprenylcysteine carboxylmethyltransferase family protein [Acidimicrobiales bacterium]